MAKVSTDSPTKDATSNDVVKSYASQLGITEMDALKVLVTAGAEKISKEMNANAFTTPSDVFAGTGSNAKSGSKNLISHELTHVTQQGSAANSVGDLERSAKQAQFFNRKKNASSDASNR